jgi:hypothetical protein
MSSQALSAALAEADWQLRSQYPDFRRCCSILTTLAARPADSQSLRTADAQLVASLTRRLLFRFTSSDASLRRPADDLQACSFAAGAALCVLRLWLQAHTLRSACDKDVLDVALHCAWHILDSNNSTAVLSAGNIAAEAVLLLAATSSILATKSTVTEHWHKLMHALSQSNVCKALLSWRQQLSTVVSTLLLRYFEQQQPHSQSTAAIVNTILQMWHPTKADTDELYYSALPDLATGFCSITHSPACTASVCEVLLSVCTNYGQVMQQNSTTQAATHAAAIVALSGLLRGVHTVLQQSRTTSLDKAVTDIMTQQQSSAIATLHSASQWCVTNSEVTATTVEIRQLQCGVGVAAAVAAAALCEMYDTPPAAASAAVKAAVTQPQIGVFSTALQHVITNEAMCLHDSNGVAIASTIQPLLPMLCDALGKLIYTGTQTTRQMCVIAVIDAVQAILYMNAVAAAHSTTASISTAQASMLTVTTSLRRATSGGVLSLIGAVVQAATIANDTIKLSDLVRYIRLLSCCSAVPVDSNTAQATTAIASLNSMLREQLLTSLAHQIERHSVDGVYAVMQTMPAVEHLKNWRSSSSSSNSSSIQSMSTVAQQAFTSATTSSSSSDEQQHNGDHLAIVAYSSDRVWLYVQLAERWLASTGHVMQQLVCSKLIPLLLFTCFSSTLRPTVLMQSTNSSTRSGSVYSRQLSTTVTAAHTVLWQLLSYQYLLYDAPVATTSSDTAAADTAAAVTAANTEQASGHTVRQRLACAYCKLALHTYPVVTDAAVLSSAIGLLIGAMGQSECDQGAAISCLQSVKERVVQLCASDTQLLDEATRTCLSLLCQTLKIAPQRLLPLAIDVVGSAVQEVMQCTKQQQQQHSNATDTAISTASATAGSGSNEIAQRVVGRVVFDAIAYDCEPSRRFDVCNWYQKLAVSSRL